MSEVFKLTALPSRRWLAAPQPHRLEMIFENESTADVRSEEQRT